jgi:hypothetical protein
LDEELSSRQKRLAPENLNQVGWAKPAQPSSRLLYATPLLRSSTRIKPSPKAKPSPDVCILNRGPAAVYSGANSIASALHVLNERDLAKNQSHFKPELPTRHPKADLSTLLEIGHFYFALTVDAFRREFSKLLQAIATVDDPRVHERGRSKT